MIEKENPSLHIRIEPELAKRVRVAAEAADTSMNRWVRWAVRLALEEDEGVRRV